MRIMGPETGVKTTADLKAGPKHLNAYQEDSRSSNPDWQNLP